VCVLACGSGLKTHLAVGLENRWSWPFSVVQSETSDETWLVKVYFLSTPISTNEFTCPHTPPIRGMPVNAWSVCARLADMCTTARVVPRSVDVRRTTLFFTVDVRKASMHLLALTELVFWWCRF
jgi:hypothetical protein